MVGIKSLFSGPDLKPGTRGFQAGILSNKKAVDLSRFKAPIRSGRININRRDW